MMVQAMDGRIHHLSGANLPDSISLYCGIPYSGAHQAEVLLSPKNAKGIPLKPAASWRLSPQNCFYLVAGMIFYGVLRALVDMTVESLV